MTSRPYRISLVKTAVRKPTTLAVFLLAVVALLICLDQAVAQKPNVIVIVTDDAGYADFGFARRGLDPDNPNAARGVTMSRAYVAPNCQPTRAALVSGAYQQRIGFENVGNNNYLHLQRSS